MFSKFDEESRKILINAKKEMTNLKHPYVGSEHLLLAILADKKNTITKYLERKNVTYDSFRKEIVKVIGVGHEANSWFLFTPLLKKIIELAIINCKESNIEVTTEQLFLAIIEEGEGVAIRTLLGMGIDLNKIYDDFSNKSFIKKNKSKKKLIIDEYGYDMNKMALNQEIDPVIGRDKEVTRVIEILCRRTKNNPLLLGEAGVGKTAIVEELARRIVNNNVPEQLKDKRIVNLPMANLIAGTKYRGEFEERITHMLGEIENDPNIIIFIDEMHTLMGAGGAEGAIDASNILKPVLARGKIKVIGATTTEEYKKYIEDDRALDRRFQPVIIEEPTLEQLRDILIGIKPIYEKYHNVVIDDKIIDLIILLSNKYIMTRSQPDKSIDLMDEVSSKISTVTSKEEKQISNIEEQLSKIRDNKNKEVIDGNYNQAISYKNMEIVLENDLNKINLKKSKRNIQKSITLKDVIEVLSNRLNIHPSNIFIKGFTDYLDIEKKLKTKVIGQDQAIKEIVTALSRKSEYFKETKPLSFLLIGPTGVGKTLLAKTVNNVLFSKNNLIRLDMSEYKEEYSISKIIGSPPGYVGYGLKNTILHQVRGNPNSVVLLDEIEKAHPSIINLFMQILDEGVIKDSTGIEVNFNNCIIFMTSNKKVDANRIGFNDDKISVLDALKNDFNIEVINRINNILVLNSLPLKDIKKIILNIEKEYLTNNNINDIKLSTKDVDKIISESSYEVLGARKIDSLVKNKINDYLNNKNIDKKNVNRKTIYS